MTWSRTETLNMPSPGGERTPVRCQSTIIADAMAKGSGRRRGEAGHGLGQVGESGFAGDQGVQRRVVQQVHGLAEALPVAPPGPPGGGNLSHLRRAQDEPPRMTSPAE